LFTGYWLVVALAFVKFPAANFLLAANRKPENSLP
jgi:hypothetical protein